MPSSRWIEAAFHRWFLSAPRVAASSPRSRQHAAVFSSSMVRSWKSSSVPFARFETFKIRGFHDSRSSSETASPFASIEKLVEEQVKAGHLQPDVGQRKVAKRLSRLQQALDGYDNTEWIDHLETKKKLKKEALQKDEPSKGVDQTETATGNVATNIRNNTDVPEVKLRIPRGLYIHGTVGTGKSMLMDMFYKSLVSSSSMNKAARYHFHAFLAQVHSLIHQQKQESLRTKGRSFSIDVTDQPIQRVAHELSKRYRVLCLDEFQVTDIADAILLSQLFGTLFRNGTIVVTTSNRPPRDLYEGGLNREYYFLPFLNLLEKHCIVHKIGSNLDYRKLLALSGDDGDGASLFVKEKNADDVIEDVLAQLDLTLCLEPTILQTRFQRTLQINTAYESFSSSSVMTNESCPTSTMLRLASVEFDELCDHELGSSDYHALAGHFDLVVLRNVPTLDLKQHNIARRFITLVDELYDAKCGVLCCTLDATTPTDLFQSSPGKRQEERKRETSELEEVVLGVDISTQGGTAVGALASVRELEFAFERASSRLFEMCSPDTWDKIAQAGR